MFDLKNKKVLVIGLGASGFAAAKLAAAKGARVSITENSDSDSVKKFLKMLETYKVQAEIGAHTEKFFGKTDLVITSPGIDKDALPLVIARSRKIPIIGELELGYQFLKAPVIAITGTNGKSTTTELIGHILSVSGFSPVVCGNIGNPLSGEVDSITEKDVAVIEVSSFQLETIVDFRPHVAILLNITEDHYERHCDYFNYKHMKFEVFRNQSHRDWAILHSAFKKDPFTEGIKSRILFFGEKSTIAGITRDGISINLERVAPKGSSGENKIFIDFKNLPLKGVHNFDNVVASVLASKIMGAANKDILKGIKGFKALAHRFETIANFRGIEFIDDSKATNIDAAAKALESMTKPVVLIAGGKDKGGDYTTIRSLVEDKVRAMVLIGEARGKIRNAFSQTIPIFDAENMESAVQKAASIAKEGDAVMLSPMCSSFDMFRDYKHRGKVFQDAVRLLCIETPR